MPKYSTFHFREDYCSSCSSDYRVRNGRTRNGKQRFLCKSCGCSGREYPQRNGYDPEQREFLLSRYRFTNSEAAKKMGIKALSLREIQRVYGVSRNTMTSWLKKSG
jgi:transposase-like protein